MSIRFNCGSCGKSYSVSQEKAGKKAQCAKCGNVMRIPASGTQMPSPSTMPDPFQLNPTGHDPLQGHPTFPAPAQEQTAPIQCLSCGQEYRPAPEMLGRTITCKCGAQVALVDLMAQPYQVPIDPLTGQPATAYPQPVQPAAPKPQQQQRPKTKQERERELLAQYNERDEWRRQNNDKHEGAFAFEKNAFDQGVAGGILLIVIAVVWFTIGLAFGIIFIWPPIMFAIGIIAIIHGLVT